MQLTAADLESLRNKAAEVAENTAGLIRHNVKLEAQRVGIKSINKAVGCSTASQILTKTDLACDKLIRQGLSKACQDYDLALLTEEGLDDRARLEKDYFWCVDPLDGTLAFSRGQPGYAVSIALVRRDGVPVIGVVCDVVNNILYSAVLGLGASRNGQDFKTYFKKRLHKRDQALPLTVFCDESFTTSADFKLVESRLAKRVLELGYPGIQIQAGAGAVMNACFILERPPALYFKRPKKERGGGSLWDFAATTAIFNALPAFASDAFGNPLKLNPKGSTFMNEYGVLFASDELLGLEIQALIRQFF